MLFLYLPNMAKGPKEVKTSINIWNVCPDKIVTLLSVNNFKSQIDIYMIEIYFHIVYFVFNSYLIFFVLFSFLFSWWFYFDPLDSSKSYSPWALPWVSSLISYSNHNNNTEIFLYTNFVSLAGREARPTSGLPNAVSGLAFSGKSIHFNYTQIPRCE